MESCSLQQEVLVVFFEVEAGGYRIDSGRLKLAVEPRLMIIL